ncbi:diguanylate cyclase [uncultured Paraglaciecola sp.]|uniref:GGDEF domain-containing protein n=1 Tax=uncultured Paraglaciecola sp. TaxID=1765024 RepID=UPI00259491C9|nr:diguanylate cyclase [uncultured Paraglaciecola sp.]
MDQFTALLLNIALYSIVPLYLTTNKSQTRLISFYVYNGVVLFIGSFAGSVYSFSLAENLVVSGGNIAFGAFLMNTVMLIIIERNVDSLRNMLRFVILIDTFIFVIFYFIYWVVSSEIGINTFNLPAELFSISFNILLLGGALIIFELFVLIVIFTQVSKLVSNVAIIAIVYTLAFIFVMCLDGFLFPIIAFSTSPQLTEIIVGNVYSKWLLAMCYSVPLLIFYTVFKHKLIQFIEAPLQIKDFVFMPRRVLLEKLHQYEERDKKLQKEKEELLDVSMQDGLTCLFNRRKYDQELAAEWQKCELNASPLTLVIGDVDFFKAYNDFYGHGKGDECLKEVAILWKGIFKRPSDIGARIGGEEFAFILPNTSVQSCVKNLEKFMQKLRKKHIPHEKSSVAAHLTMSCGVASVVPSEEGSIKELFAIADLRLYKAKEMGRNTIVAK